MNYRNGRRDMPQNKLQQIPLQEEYSDNSSEPLMDVTDVLLWNKPEKVEEEIPSEAEYAEYKIKNRTPYENWQYDPTPDNLYNVVNYLKPTITSVLASIGGTSPDIKAKARIVTAKAVQSYNPESGASLPTWVSSQLRQLTRDVRKSNNTLSIPESAQLDAYHLYKVEQELLEDLDREPTVEEIADKAAMSIKKIEAIRRKVRPVVAETSFEQDDGSTALGISTADYTQEALDYIYQESDLKDKKLLEHLLGYGGSEVWDNKLIMNKLKLTPVQLSRRKMRLIKRIQDITSNLEQI